MTIPHFDDAEFKSLTYPFSKGLPPVLTGANVDADSTPESGENNAANDLRIKMYPFLFQRGKYLDYYTGLHEPSITDTLRNVLRRQGSITDQDIKDIVPADMQDWFPQLSIDVNWPATIMIHGTVDEIVPIEESRYLFEAIAAKSKSPVRLIEIKDDYAVHSWDCFPGAEAQSKAEFDSIKDFIQEHL
ncbi:hypothetical protein D9613_012103 [Agrocybe pediades]|uniref:Peptidase S9 prolyl oligopeptidase catalytic domain-containing protein n=1 Tax=Agrocybe pediades TaxID=84607 RepID=A0A8H4VVI1_9AGAR|nr:hypothetical protein D9613_012103 [Agrocybe pediades]